MEAKEQATKKRRLKQEERAATGPTEKDLAEIDAQTEEHAKWQALLESGTRVGEAAKTTWTPAQIRGKMKWCENTIRRHHHHQAMRQSKNEPGFKSPALPI